MTTLVLIVDDIAALRAYAARVVHSIAPNVIETIQASDGLDGIRLAKSRQPDLVIMDISMPDMGGLRAAKQIWADCPTRKILFWSQFHREAYVRELAKILPDEAIHGYALKGECDEQLRYAIEAVLLHENPYIDPVVRGVQSRLQNKSNSLTDVEYETLVDIACGLTDKAIAARRHISVRGVQNRLSMLLDKLVKGEDAHLRETTSMEIYNPRTRLVFEAAKRGLLCPDELVRLESEMREWLANEYDFDETSVFAPPPMAPSIAFR